jgi:hypothetical protein
MSIWNSTITLGAERLAVVARAYKNAGLIANAREFESEYYGRFIRLESAVSELGFDIELYVIPPKDMWRPDKLLYAAGIDLIDHTHTQPSSYGPGRQGIDYNDQGIVCGMIREKGDRDEPILLDPDKEAKTGGRGHVLATGYTSEMGNLFSLPHVCARLLTLVEFALIALIRKSQGRAIGNHNIATIFPYMHVDNACDRAVTARMGSSSGKESITINSISDSIENRRTAYSSTGVRVAASMRYID